MTDAPAHYLDALARFADFDGRASRAEFWGFALVHGVVTAALAAASAVLGVVLDVAWIVGGAVFALYAVLTFFPALSAAARRLHDVGRSSLLVGLVLVPPFGLLVLYWLCLPGEPGPNDWGRRREG